MKPVHFHPAAECQRPKGAFIPEATAKSLARLTLPFLGLVLFFPSPAAGQADPPRPVAEAIAEDKRLDTVSEKSLELLKGFSAGTSYNEIWIRDFTTFIKGSLKVHPKEEVREKLLLFLKIQGEDGNIVDGVVPKDKANLGYDYRHSDLLPDWAAHKNTVETDQESSLVQAFGKYVQETGDKEVLNLKIANKTVIERLEDSLLYVMKDRFSPKYGLVTGATTIDWGDVQPERGWGVAINEHTKWCIDVYDNAMFSMAIDAFVDMLPAGYRAKRDWRSVQAKLKQNVRKHLWDADKKKYIPHLYLDGSPFSKDFDENSILYSGGSICAVLAGFNTKEEVLEIYKQLLAASKKEAHATIGLTVYPPYPVEEFPNMPPYTYQNGGDWTWFGGRMIEGLVRYGHVAEAYEALVPMVERVIANNGFYEWYDARTGKPSGSGDFRGEAGVLYDAIALLRAKAGG